MISTMKGKAQGAMRSPWCIQIRRMTGVDRRSGARGNPGRGSSSGKGPGLALYKPNLSLEYGNRKSWLEKRAGQMIWVLKGMLRILTFLGEQQGFLSKVS